MGASIWSPQSTTIPQVNSNLAAAQEKCAITAGQTLVNLTRFTYTPGTNSLVVFINGIMQFAGFGLTETSSSSFTLSIPLVGTDSVVALGFTQVTGTLADISTLPPFIPASKVTFSPPAGMVSGDVQDVIVEVYNKISAVNQGKLTFLQSLANFATVASATILNLTTPNSNNLYITGTAVIGSITLPEGAVVNAQAQGTFTISNNAVISVQGGQNYAASVGDWIEFIGMAGGVVAVNITKANGYPTIRLSNILPSATPTLSAGAMTLPSLQYTLDFRNASLGAGGTTTVTGTPAALTIPSGATLGTISGVQSTIAKVVINNAGTLEYAVVNIAGGNDLSETGVISTTAISGTSTANNVFYSNTARSNVPYRVVEILQSTQATAGTWATAPSLVQGVGGEAFTAFSGFGKTQKYNSYNSSTRAVGTTYYNTTQNTIFVLAGITSTSTSGLSATIILGGNTTSLGSTAFVSGTLLQLLFPVPPGASYSVTSTAGTPAWASWVEFS